MSPAMAASRASVCVLAILLMGTAGARAERRPVAVVDLASAPPTQELARQLRAELEAHPELRTLPDPSDAAALIDPLDDPDTRRIERALEEKKRAEEELSAYNHALALKLALDGQAELLTVTPSSAARLYGDLALVAGIALFDAGRSVEARRAFALAARLDPARTLDPARVVPEVVAAYAQAKATVAPPGSVEIKGSGNVWIDGIELGVAPGNFAVAEGEHVVWLTGVDRETRGAAVVVAGGKPTVLEIPTVEASRRTRIQRARQLLARAPDPTARAAAMTRLANLLGVQDAVLLSLVNAKVVVQTWRAGNVDRAPGFSALRERGTAEPAELLVPLAPRKVVVPDEPPIKLPPIVVTKKWYERRSVQAGIVLGVAAAIVGGVMLSRSGPDSVLFDPGITVDTGTTSKQ